MKLKDVKQGMICKLRNGGSITVVDYGLFAKKVEILTPEINYNGDFTHKKNKDLDIMKITYSNEISIPEKDYNEDFTHRHNIDYDIMEITFGDKAVFKRNESRWFVPEDGERYYYVRSFGDVNSFSNSKDDTDYKIFNIVKVFKTKEEAEKRLRQQQATLSVERWIAENDVEVDVFNKNVKKYHVYYDIEEKEIDFFPTYLYTQAPKQFILSSREKVKQLIKEREKELKIMFGVEE